MRTCTPDLYTIAEIGVNHEGSLDVAKQLISQAKDCGFSAVKLQHIIPELIWHSSCPSNMRLSHRECLPDTWLFELVKYSHNQGIDIGCTPTFQSSSDLIKQSNCDFIKIASPQARYDWFILQEALNTKLPLVISNGYCTFQESIHLIDYLVPFRQTRDITFLYCIAKYPADDVAMDTDELFALSQHCLSNSISFGLSDHNQSMMPALLIRNSFGGTTFEKHFSDVATNSLDKDVSIYSWQASEYVRQLNLPQPQLKCDRHSLLTDKSHIFASSFFLIKDVFAGDAFDVSHCCRLRDGTSHSLDTSSFWSKYHRDSNLFYTRDICSGSRIEEGDLK